LDSNLKEYTRNNSFAELYDFIRSFNKKIKIWADFLKSQTYFFDSIIQNDSETERPHKIKSNKNKTNNKRKKNRLFTVNKTEI
jgi:hypothetical protein